MAQFLNIIKSGSLDEYFSTDNTIREIIQNMSKTLNYFILVSQM